jgi:hypothetical protein
VPVFVGDAEINVQLSTFTAGSSDVTVITVGQGEDTNEEKR